MTEKRERTRLRPAAEHDLRHDDQGRRNRSTASITRATRPRLGRRSTHSNNSGAKSSAPTPSPSHQVSQTSQKVARPEQIGPRERQRTDGRGDRRRREPDQRAEQRRPAALAAGPARRRPIAGRRYSPATASSVLPAAMSSDAATATAGVAAAIVVTLATNAPMNTPGHSHGRRAAAPRSRSRSAARRMSRWRGSGRASDRPTPPGVEHRETADECGRPRPDHEATRPRISSTAITRSAGSTGFTSTCSQPAAFARPPRIERPRSR